MSEPIRVMITDDHLIVREGLRLIMETVDDMDLVGEATNGREAVQLAEELGPDVILMDMRMPEMDGLAAIGHIKTNAPEIAIVILTTYNEDELMLQGLRAGASAFLLKDTGRGTLLNTIRAAAAGKSLLEPEIMVRLLEHTEHTPSPPPPQVGTTELSPRETEVLAAVARGERNKEIAYHLGISERTVKAHLTSVYNKLGVDSRAAAVAVASQLGLLAID
jgi:NarL family two-component system response regulator YdfI